MRALVLALVLALAPSAALAAPQAVNAKVDASLEALNTGKPIEARRLAEEAAASGDPMALNNLVVFLENGVGGPRDPGRARKLLEQAVAGGLPVAKLNLGIQLHFSSNAADQVRGYDLLRQAAQDEKARPMTLWPLGRAQLLGIGTKQDLRAGVDALEESLEVDQARADAFFLVARAYQNGWGGRTPDLAKAYDLFSEAARQGDERAERYVGMARLRGDGTARDEKGAMVAFRSAAEKGSVDAMIDVAVMLAIGEGVPAEPAQARSWYRRAADKGSAHALRGLGAMLVRGEGGPADIATGRAYLELAAAGGDENAPKILGGAIGPLPPADRAAVEAAKATWLRNHPPPR